MQSTFQVPPLSLAARTDCVRTVVRSPDCTLGASDFDRSFVLSLKERSSQSKRLGEALWRYHHKIARKRIGRNDRPPPTYLFFCHECHHQLVLSHPDYVPTSSENCQNRGCAAWIIVKQGDHEQIVNRTLFHIRSLWRRWPLPQMSRRILG